MLPPYANNTTKQIIVMLSGSKGFCRTLLNAKDYRNKEKADEHLRIALEQIQLALDAVCENLNEEQMNGVLKFTRNSQLAVLPISSIAGDKKEYIVNEDDLRTILQGVVSECVFCDKEGAEAKNCPILLFKKALLASQVVPNNHYREDCPYKD